ncbi:MAG TPA: PIG-L deacetylase family protein [Pirellulaceae bacterium]
MNPISGSKSIRCSLSFSGKTFSRDDKKFVTTTAATRQSPQAFAEYVEYTVQGIAICRSLAHGTLIAFFFVTVLVPLAKVFLRRSGLISIRFLAAYSVRYTMPERRQEVLVLAPHPDDETFGCGGTIRMLADRGVAVDVAFLTRGEQGLEGATGNPATEHQLADTRTHEARKACAVLGARSVVFLGGSDTRLGEEPELASAIAELLSQTVYQRVFCPWPEDAHSDHQATFRLLREAVIPYNKSLNFWLYEVWKPLPANTFVPIDLTIDSKREAIDQYESQLSQLDYREAFLGLAAYRGLFCPPSKYAEAFLVCDRDEMLALA